MGFWYDGGVQLYRKTSHTTFDLKYHLVWITKYRKPILEGKIAYRVRELIREICGAHNIQIIRGHVSKGSHSHFYFNASANFGEQNSAIPQREDIQEIA